MAPQLVAQARGGSADELQEVQITPRYIVDEVEVTAKRLDNNPRLVDQSRNVTPDERVAREADARRIAEAVQRIPEPPADLQTLEEVVVTAQRDLNPHAENWLARWPFGDNYRMLGYDIVGPTRPSSTRDEGSYRDGFVARAAVVADALHVEQGAVNMAYDSALAEAANANNPWGYRAVNYAGAAAMFPLAIGEELMRGVLNVPSAVFGAIPAAHRGGELPGEAFDSSLPTSDRIIAGGNAYVEFATAFLGLGGPASLATTPIAAAPLAGEQLALRGFQGAEATELALATYRIADEHPLQGFTPSEAVQQVQALGLQTARDSTLLWSGLGRGREGIVTASLRGGERWDNLGDDSWWPMVG